MPKDKIKIIDESGDRKYFTIVPNYILNHSTANDQALYFQMKRYAGESGKCFASEKTLMKQLGIGRKSIKKSLAYLLSHNWIELIGKKPVNTRGGRQDINTYKVVDIWKLNTDNYDKGVSEREPLNKQRGVPKSIKGVSERATEEEPYKEEPIKNANDHAFAPFDLKEEIEKLKSDKQRHIQLIGEYIEEKNIKLENKEQLKRTIGRHLRSARALADFSDKQIGEATVKAQNEYPAYTLETLLKILTR